MAFMVLWADARSAAETGNRPVFNEDDLKDMPIVKEWLMQPLIANPPSVEASRQMVQAAMIRLLRTFGSDFRRRESSMAYRLEFWLSCFQPCAVYNHRLWIFCPISGLSSRPYPNGARTGSWRLSIAFLSLSARLKSTKTQCRTSSIFWLVMLQSRTCASAYTKF